MLAKSVAKGSSCLDLTLVFSGGRPFALVRLKQNRHRPRMSWEAFGGGICGAEVEAGAMENGTGLKFSGSIRRYFLFGSIE